MNNVTKKSQPRLRRVLVSLDSAFDENKTLDAAIEMAIEIGAELRGLFLEDTNLVNLANLPFAREFHPSTATRRQIDTTSLQRSFRAQARRMQNLIESRAREAKLEWRFSQLNTETNDQSEPALAVTDVVIISSFYTLKAQRCRPAEPNKHADRATYAHNKRIAALLKSYLSAHNALSVLTDSLELNDKTLSLAIALSKLTDAKLNVLLITHNTLPSQNDIQQFIASLAANHIHGQIQTLNDVPAQSLINTIESLTEGMLLLDSQHAQLSREQQRQLVKNAKFPILLKQ